MELIKPGININFIGRMKMFFFISIILTVASILFLVLRGGPNLGIDFAGGTSLQIKFNQATTIDKIRQTLDSINLGKNSIIQQVGSKGDNEFLLRTEVTTSDLKGLTDKIEETLSAAYGKGAIEIRKAEVVGPKAGKDLSRKGFLALCFSFIGMLIYISWRYEFRFALGGILALIHDVIVTVGVFTLMGKEFTLTVIAALLTIVGFSINYTVVVFDRIRENIKKSTKGSLGEIMNASINQTLSRTILTSLTVVLVLLALLFFGGEVLRDFTITLLIGVVFGTYSSVFIASPLVLIWENYRPTLKKKKK
jgi:preprotein translocase subunit SecF